ncbi:MAG TPA: cellulase family glycosylhydrolase [Gammaproteobacteria bacterium]|nr:cellulase family glycosylhydrolase [Gammaproteobacteria bacterium]
MSNETLGKTVKTHSANFDETVPLLPGERKLILKRLVQKILGIFGGLAILGGGITGIVFLVRRNTGTSVGGSGIELEFQNSSPYTLKLQSQSGQDSNCTCAQELQPGEKQVVTLDNASGWSDIEYDVFNNGTYIGHLGVRVTSNAISVSNENNLYVTTVPQTATESDVKIIRASVRPGLNQAGFEFGNNPNQINPPTPANVDAANARSFSSYRMPFKLEYAASPEYVQKYVKEVEYALSTNAEVIVEPHNYMLFNGKPITPQQCQSLIGQNFVGLFSGLSAKYPGKLIVEAMNEPTDVVTPEQLVECYTPLIKAARAQGFKGKIVIEGNTWATPNVLTNPDGTASAQFNALKPLLTDKATYGEVVLGIHCYFNNPQGGGSGTSECIPANTVLEVNRIPQLTALAQVNGIKIRVTEMGVINSPNCQAVLSEMADHIYQNQAVYEGYNMWVQTPVSNPAWTPLLLDLEEGKDERVDILEKYMVSPTSYSSTASARFYQPAPQQNISGTSAVALGAGIAAPAVIALLVIGLGGAAVYGVYCLYNKFYGSADEKVADIEQGKISPKNP